MYLTIDKEFIIKKENIIGVFNIESMMQTREYKTLFEKIKNENKLIDFSKGEEKTFILYQKDKESYGIISNVSSSSIEKRGKSKLI